MTKHNFEKVEDDWDEENYFLRCQTCGYHKLPSRKSADPKCPIIPKDMIATLRESDEYEGYFEHYEHKVNAVSCAEDISWWYVKHIGPSTNLKTRVFVIVKGVIYGFFTLDEITYDWTDMEWHLRFDKHFYIKPIKMTGFRGKRFRKFDYTIIPKCSYCGSADIKKEKCTNCGNDFKPDEQVRED